MKKPTHFILSTVVVVMFLVFSIGVVQAGTCEIPDFASASFDDPDDNPYLSRDSIGKTYVYETETDEGIVRDFQYFYTPSPAKTILGVDVIEVYDVEYLYVEDLGEWKKLEETWDWYAWDNLGNWWYFGEDTTEYEYNDEWTIIGCSNDGAWEAGQDVAGVGTTAEPGIILPADPGPGDCNYEEYYEGEAEDVGKVLRVTATCEDHDGNESEECMVMKEWTAQDRGNVEQKTYYPDLGLVHIKELKGKTVEFELVAIINGGFVDLDPGAVCP